MAQSSKPKTRPQPAELDLSTLARAEPPGQRRAPRARAAEPHASGSEAPDPYALIEACLFVGGPPLSAARIAQSLAGSDHETVVRAVAQLNHAYHRQGRPYEIRRVGSGYQMTLRPQFARIARRVAGQSRQVRLSQAAVEVLSLVAYNQPVTAHDVDAVRGTDSSAILRQLRRRNLIDTVGHAERGRAAQYGTTRRFLELFHLAGLDELPRVEEFEKL